MARPPQRSGTDTDTVQSRRQPIAFFLASLRCGGAERMTLNLIQALQAWQLPVDLILAKAEGEMLADLPPNVRLIDLDRRRLRCAIGGLIRYLRCEQPWGMISRVDHANVVAALACKLARTRIPLIVTVSSRLLAFPDATTLSFPRAFLRRQTLLPLLRWAYRRSAAVVAVSRGIADELCQNLHLDPASIRVIHNPVVTRQIEFRAIERPDHPWLENRPVPVVLAVGRLVWQKDYATLLRGFSYLRRRRAARLIIAGEGPQRQELENLRRTLGLDDCCDLPGYLANPYSAMAHADLLVLSSRSEGSPNVLAEALACGCPVVATDCPNGPREILDAGRYGLLAPVGDAPALAVAMEKTLDWDWDRSLLRRRANDFSNFASARQYLEALGYFERAPFDTHIPLSHPFDNLKESRKVARKLG